MAAAAPNTSLYVKNLDNKIKKTGACPFQPLLAAIAIMLSDLLN